MSKLTSLFNKDRIIIIVLAFCLYGNTIKNKYSLDDNIVTEKENITAQGLKSIPKIISSFYVDRGENNKYEYRPVVKISFAVEHELFGVNPAVSHFFNVLLYACCLLLLLKFLQLVFVHTDQKILFYTVIVFALMPIHTEVVASLKNRDILLCFIFTMLSGIHILLFYTNNQKQYYRLVLFVVFICLAFGSKFDVLAYLAVIPFLLVLRGHKKLSAFIVPFVLFAAGYGIYKLARAQISITQGQGRGFTFVENPLHFDPHFGYKIYSFFNSLGFYVAQSIFPAKQCSYYGFDTIAYNHLDAFGIIGIASSVIILCLFYISYKTKDVFLACGLFMFSASVSMYLNFAKAAAGIVADRFAFFASAGIAIILVRLFYLLHQKYNFNLKTSKYILLGIGCVAAIVIVKRNTDWKDLNTLITADVNKYENNQFLNYKAGLMFSKEAESKSGTISADQRMVLLTQAKQHLEKANRIYAKDKLTLNYLSYLMVYQLHNFKSAMPYIDQSLQLEYNNEIMYYKAICYFETGKKDSCNMALLTCIKKDSSYYNAYNLLSYNYNAEGRFQQSIDLYNNAIAKGVVSAAVYTGLGKTYLQMNDKGKAKIYFEKAITLDPAYQEAVMLLKTV